MRLEHIAEFYIIPYLLYACVLVWGFDVIYYLIFK